ncbi:hypothetical protein BH789_gp070 [Gordonia phage GMA6]|uniref:Uncharacterized protein n=1 Tax=Gordonia phage GMA6 TaxID=1647285 RepID=A0A0K0NKT9_9CAUD|nr:hypothetical protein BH789_gp070 [Gordonia phage GMA6]AKL88351.1 hypothetical protein GMA6_70 [Gordonia phage GMA6]
MLIYCSRGCGYPIEVTQEVIDEATSHGVPVQVSHEAGKCPGDSGLPDHRYRMTVTVEREPNPETGEGGETYLLTKVGGFTDANTLSDAFDKLTEMLGEQWQKVSEMKYLAEQNLGG